MKNLFKVMVVGLALIGTNLFAQMPEKKKSQGSESVEFIHNGGFELGLEGWLKRGSATFQLTNDPVSSGDSALVQIDAGESNHGTLQNITDAFKDLELGYSYPYVFKISIMKPAAFAGSIETLVQYWEAGEEYRLYMTKITPDMESDTWIHLLVDWRTVYLRDKVDSAIVMNYAWGCDGSSEWYIDDFSFSIAKPLAPQAPTGLMAEMGPQSATLTWDRPEDDIVQSYLVKLDGDSVTSVEDTTALVSGLEYSTSYEFEVVANNVAGSSESAKITAVTLIDPSLMPTAPSDLSALGISGQQIDLSWTDVADNEDGYYVQLNSNSEWENVDTLEANVEAYMLTELTEGTEYTIRVSPYNEYGTMNSDPVKATTFGVGIQSSSVPEITVSPNPVSTVLSIQVEGSVEWKLYNLAGSEVLSGNQNSIDMSVLERGLFLLKINSEEQGYKHFKIIRD